VPTSAEEAVPHRVSPHVAHDALKETCVVWSAGTRVDGSSIGLAGRQAELLRGRLLRR